MSHFLFGVVSPSQHAQAWLLVYETGINILELTTRKGDKTPLYLSVSMMYIVPETVCWTSGKSSLTRFGAILQMLSIFRKFDYNLRTIDLRHLHPSMKYVKYVISHMPIQLV